MTKWFLNFDFSRRARRSHYWANYGSWVAILVVLVLIAAGLGAQKGGAGPGALFILLVVVGLVLAGIDGLAMVFRRAHDTGRSGWIMLLLLIPLVNLIPLYWLMIQDSDQGPNKYGPPEKQFYEPETSASV
jgi:uncharacterized membrane protein YhaH (DUF805 family)